MEAKERLNIGLAVVKKTAAQGLALAQKNTTVYELTQFGWLNKASSLIGAYAFFAYFLTLASISIPMTRISAEYTMSSGFLGTMYFLATLAFIFCCAFGMRKSYARIAGLTAAFIGFFNILFVFEVHAELSRYMADEEAWELFNASLNKFSIMLAMIAVIALIVGVFKHKDVNKNFAKTNSEG